MLLGYINNPENLQLQIDTIEEERQLDIESEQLEAEERALEAAGYPVYIS